MRKSGLREKPVRAGGVTICETHSDAAAHRG